MLGAGVAVDVEDRASATLVMPGTLITAGMPSSRATMAAWLCWAPVSHTTAAAARNSGVHEVGDGAHEDLAGLESARIAGIEDGAGASRCPAAVHPDPGQGRADRRAARAHRRGASRGRIRDLVVEPEGHPIVEVPLLGRPLSDDLVEVSRRLDVARARRSSRRARAGVLGVRRVRPPGAPARAAPVGPPGSRAARMSLALARRSPSDRRWRRPHEAPEGASDEPLRLERGLGVGSEPPGREVGIATSGTWRRRSMLVHGTRVHHPRRRREARTRRCRGGRGRGGRPRCRPRRSFPRCGRRCHRARRRRPPSDPDRRRRGG